MRQLGNPIGFLDRNVLDVAYWVENKPPRKV